MESISRTLEIVIILHFTSPSCNSIWAEEGNLGGFFGRFVCSVSVSIASLESRLIKLYTDGWFLDGNLLHGELMCCRVE